MATCAIMIDLERCIGCKTCMVACKLENGLLKGQSRSEVTWIAPTKERRVSFEFKACMHCEKPLCIPSCPTRAIYKDSKRGIVLIDKEKCRQSTKCHREKKCRANCPNAAISFRSPGEIADKCTYCFHRLNRDEQPACVEACPAYALIFGDKEDLMKHARSKKRNIRKERFSKLKPSNIYLERIRA